MCDCSVMSNTLRPFGLQPARLLCPWGFPGENTGGDCHQGCRQVQPEELSAWGPLLESSAHFLFPLLRAEGCTLKRSSWAELPDHLLLKKYPPCPLCVCTFGHCLWFPPFSLQCVSSQRRHGEFRRAHSPRRRKTWAFLLPHRHHGGKSKAVVTLPVCESVCVCIMLDNVLWGCCA